MGFIKDFPILNEKMNGKRLVYLDNAATSQKPVAVIEALEDYYLKYNANIHRAIYSVAEKATQAYENTRKLVSDFINSTDSSQIIFTRNATEAINLVAYTWGETNIKKGDEIIVSIMEHHSNLVTWQELCCRKKAVLKIIPLNEDLNLDLKVYQNLLTKKTKLVAVTQMANVTGVVTQLAKIIKLAHKKGALVLVDGAQGVPHLGIDVKKLDCDFLAFSAHKMCGPTGVGVLYGKRILLEKMPPFLFGGEMISHVTLKKASWNEIPWKFEAGTPNIADVIAFGEAIKYLQKIGMEYIRKFDALLLEYALFRFSALKGIIIHLPKDLSDTGGILSFNIPGVHPHDIGSIFNEEGVAIRVGNLCAEPFVTALKSPGVARMSFYFYNTKEDVDAAFKAAQKVYKIFGL